MSGCLLSSTKTKASLFPAHLQKKTPVNSQWLPSYMLRFCRFSSAFWRKSMKKNKSQVHQKPGVHHLLCKATWFIHQVCGPFSNQNHTRFPLKFLFYLQVVCSTVVKQGLSAQLCCVCCCVPWCWVGWKAGGGGGSSEVTGRPNT